MKHIYTLLALITLQTFSLSASDLVFDMRMEKVTFEVYPLIKTDNSVPRVIEQSYLGRFYPETEIPKIDSTTAFKSSEVNPYFLLSNILKIAKSDDFKNLPKLYSPDSRGLVKDALKDEKMGPPMRQWMKSIESFSVLGYFYQAPNELVAYVRIADGVLPYLFVLEDQWYLRAGDLNSSFSNDLDVFYAANNYSNENLEVTYPLSTDDTRLLLSDEKLKDFAISNKSLSAHPELTE